MRRNKIESQRELAGWPVIEDPDEETIRQLRKERFTGLTVFVEKSGQFPWGIWYRGHLCTNKGTQKEAETAIIRIAGRNC